MKQQFLGSWNYSSKFKSIETLFQIALVQVPQQKIFFDIMLQCGSTGANWPFQLPGYFPMSGCIWKFWAVVVAGKERGGKGDTVEW